MRPSFLYRGSLWNTATRVSRYLGPNLAGNLSRFFTGLYGTVHSGRREIVLQNVLPALNGERAAARPLVDRLFRNFGQKLADLWAYESGAPIQALIKDSLQWEHFLEAHKPGRGTLLLTPHLGNWEFGAPLLTAKGVQLLVLTGAEPQGQFTDLRQRARARWGIETLVVGDDPFAFVEVIRRLEKGAVVALLIDRPAEASAVRVQLFGHSFMASIAASELARATGCALLPVILPRVEAGYRAEVLPQIHYDRAKIRSREARIELTQDIMRAFEPSIRQYLDQWYHFVPVWCA
jgi:lauroyl/myristoyl acyltransferase